MLKHKNKPNCHSLGKQLVIMPHVETVQKNMDLMRTADLSSNDSNIL